MMKMKEEKLQKWKSSEKPKEKQHPPDTLS